MPIQICYYLNMKSMTNQSGFSSPIAILIVLGAVVIGGVYFLSQKPESRQTLDNLPTQNRTGETNQVNEQVDTTVNNQITEPEPDFVSGPVLVEGQPFKKVDLRNFNLVVKELSGDVSSVQVDKATLRVVSSFDIPAYLRDKNNVYVYDHQNKDNWGVTWNNPNTDHYVLYRLPLNARSFRVVSYYFIADDKQVLYWNWWSGNRQEYIAVKGINAKAARDGSPKEEGVEYINPAARRGHVVVDDKQVFLGTEPLVTNQNFHFLNWQTGNKKYETIYGKSGDKIICLSQKSEGQKTQVIGNLLTAHADSFGTLLINEETYYAKDGTGNAFIDCLGLTKIANQPIQNFEIKTLFKDSRIVQILLLSDGAIYSRKGNVLSERTNKIQPFQYLDEIGNYFTIDGKVFWYSAIQNGATKVNILNNGDIDLASFKVLLSKISDPYLFQSVGAAKDKYRVYVSENEPKYPEYVISNFVFVPKDLSTFSLVDCPSQKIFFKDIYNVYAKDGSVVSGASPSTFVDDPQCKTPAG